MTRAAMQQALRILERDCQALLECHQDPATGAILETDQVAIAAFDEYRHAIAALRAALAEQDDDLTAAWMAGAAEERKRAEQAQPVAWRYRATNKSMEWVSAWAFCDSSVKPIKFGEGIWEVQPLYTTPPAPQPLQEHAECPACGEKEAKLYALFRCQECQGEYLGSAEHLKPQPLTELPPMPEPAGTLVPPAMDEGKQYAHGYTADQMRDYARAALAAERERCAQQLDALGCDHCADALRNATEAPRC